MSGPAVTRDDELFFPPEGDDWDTVDPRSLGWDVSRLELLLELLGGWGSLAFVVLHRGRIVAERHWEGTGLHDVGDFGSGQKAVVSLLVGIAVDEGLLSIDDAVSTFLGEGWTRAPRDLERRITVRHLLSMTSGLSDAFFAEAEPGTAWYYNNNAYHQVKTVLEQATGRSVDELSRSWLFEPIGANDAVWIPRPSMVDPLGRVLTGLHLSCRDMARLGLLVLARGQWAGRSVVPPAWLDAALAPSQSHNPAYGLLWWVNGSASTTLPGRRPPRSGPVVRTGPADLVMATGAGDQKLAVWTSAGVVVARRGPADGPPSVALSSFDDDFWRHLTAVVGG